jgi:catechol 2,3-dioxygenase-like lactoylglutathione lyase family enzyme
MLDRVEIAVTDPDAAQPLYDLLGCGQIALLPSGDDRAATRRLHVAVFAATRAHVDRFWLRGTASGFRDDGAPGRRPRYGPDYYGAFLLDPDGNSVEAVTSDDDRTPGHIDHLWLRTADLARARADWLDLGARLGDDTAERVQFRGDGASVSFVPGEPPTSGVTLTLAGGARWSC